MKRFLLTLLILIAIPTVIAGYCEGFNEQKCTDNGQQWFSTDNCNAKIICTPEYKSNDEFGIGSGFKSCTTTYQQNFSDCINNPSAFCYNSIAYSTTESRPCECGAGIKYKLIDSCGNPGEWSKTCLIIQSCQVEEVNVHSGLTITTHTGCTTTTCTPDGSPEDSQDSLINLPEGESPEEMLKNLPFGVDLSKENQPAIGEDIQTINSDNAKILSVEDSPSQKSIVEQQNSSNTGEVKKVADKKIAPYIVIYFIFAIFLGLAFFAIRHVIKRFF